MTFHTHDYFSSEDLDFRNLTKFRLHFFTFFCYLLRNLQDQYTKLKLEFNWKPEPPGFGNRKFRFWGKNRGQPGQGYGRRVSRTRGRGGGAAFPAGGGAGRPRSGQAESAGPRAEAARGVRTAALG